MTQIIAFTGLKQTGKTTAADYLVSKWGFVKHNFKDALVEEVKERFPDLLREIKYHEGYIYSNNQWQEPTIDELFESKPPLIRALMQNYGTEVRRKEDPDYWVKLWELSVLYEIRNDPNYKLVVDDARFINEVDSVRAEGGTIIRLTRPDLTVPDNHSSETEQSQIEVDYSIETERGDFEGLYRELDRVVNRISE